MNGKSDGLIPTVPILFVLLSIIVNWKNLPEKDQWVEGYYVPHIIEGKIVHHFLLTGEASLVETKEDELILDFYWEEIDPKTLYYQRV